MRECKQKKKYRLYFIKNQKHTKDIFAAILFSMCFHQNTNTHTKHIINVVNQKHVDKNYKKKTKKINILTHTL